MMKPITSPIGSSSNREEMREEYRARMFVYQ